MGVFGFEQRVARGEGFDAVAFIGGEAAGQGFAGAVAVAEAEVVHVLGAVAGVDGGGEGPIVDGDVVLRLVEVIVLAVYVARTATEFEGEVAPFATPGEVAADASAGVVIGVGTEVVAMVEPCEVVEGVAQRVVVPAAQLDRQTCFKFALFAVGEGIVDAEFAIAGEHAAGGAVAVAHQWLVEVGARLVAVVAVAVEAAVEVDGEFVAVVVELVGEVDAAIAAVVAVLGIALGMVAVVARSVDIFDAAGVADAVGARPRGVGTEPARDGVHGVELVAGVNAGPDVMAAAVGRGGVVLVARKVSL